MRIKIRLHGKENLKAFDKLLNRLASDAWEDEAMRGLIDAGRKVKSRVGKKAKDQAAFRTYREVSPHMRGVSDDGKLSYRIFAVRDGVSLEHYKGLRVLEARGRAAKRLQGGREEGELGGVRSDVWNATRVFKRSFATPKGTFAVLGAGEKGKRWSARGGVLPPAFWTFGKKEAQPRDAAGRFSGEGGKGKLGKIRRLFGPSLRKEIAQGEALAVFDREAPMQTKISVQKRLGRVMKF